jgi:sporulation protein YlmC with PRC-barrel domain
MLYRHPTAAGIQLLKLLAGGQFMAQHGMLRDYRFTDAAEDIRGSKLYGLNSEKLGKIDDVIFDHTSGVIRYVVVDTGGWLSTKKFLVPADRLRASAEHQDDFTVDLSKEQVEGFPPYDEAHLESDEQFADYEGRYRSKWETAPVMHRAETDRNITPTAEQMAGNAVSERASGAPSRTSFASSSTPSGTVESNNVDTGAFTEGGFASGTDSVVISQGANGIGPRWDRFQDRLRERRKEVISTGSTPESADKYRKAG